jgi:hypothetical protein
MVSVTLRHLAGAKRRGESLTSRWGIIAGRVGLGTVHVGTAHPRVAGSLSRLENKMPSEFNLAPSPVGDDRSGESSR